MGVVVVGGAVSPSLLEHGIANGIVILRGVAKQQLEGVCQLTGATPLSYLTNCLEVEYTSTCACNTICTYYLIKLYL